MGRYTTGHWAPKLLRRENDGLCSKMIYGNPRPYESHQNQRNSGRGDSLWQPTLVISDKQARKTNTMNKKENKQKGRKMMTDNRGGIRERKRSPSSTCPSQFPPQMLSRPSPRSQFLCHCVSEKERGVLLPPIPNFRPPANQINHSR